MAKNDRRSKRAKLKCPTAYKQKYWNLISAKLALAEIIAKGKQGHDECRIYKCKDHYHLTSKPR